MTGLLLCNAIVLYNKDRIHPWVADIITPYLVSIALLGGYTCPILQTRSWKKDYCLQSILGKMLLIMLTNSY